MSAENTVLNRCLIRLSEIGCRVWRNNTGALKDANGRLVRFGLCVGSSDIIGVAPDGRFLAIECKANRNRPTQMQVHFLEVVSNSGGIAGVAWSADDAEAIVRNALQNEKP